MTKLLLKCNSTTQDSEIKPSYYLIQFNQFVLAL